MQITECLLDMDGVLVDFLGPVAKLHGVDMIHSHEVHKELGITHAEFWAPTSEDFWANLPWMPDGKAILGVAERHFGREKIAICTAQPSNSKAAGEAAAGKFRWVNKRINWLKRQMFVGASKHFAAAPWRLLVDDKEENIDKFREAGGHGFLVPRPWNGNHGVDAVRAFSEFLSTC